MSSVHARILGAAGRVADCRSAMTVAEDHLADPQPTNERSGSSLFQHATVIEIALYNGHALFDATLRDPATAPAATDQLRAALGSSNSVSPRRRAVGTAKLAALELLHGDRDEGIILGHRALDLGDGVRSTRLAEDLRRLHTATGRHAAAPVEALQQRLDAVLRSA